jgi:hypothetical protein
LYFLAALFAISIIPSLTLFRGLVYLGSEVSFKGPGIKMTDITRSETNLLAVYMYLVALWVLLLAIGIYLDLVLPTGYGVKHHPLFFLGWLKRIWPISYYYKWVFLIRALTSM